jgi:hypothetical protein
LYNKSAQNATEKVLADTQNIQKDGMKSKYK